MPSADVGKMSIYYEIHGSGPTLILIRGLGSNSDHWYAQLPALAAHFQVVAFDNRGIARTTDPGGDFSIVDLAQDTLGLMDYLKCERAHVMGLSMGGMIAQEMAINYPARLEKLVLACTHAGGPQQIQPAPAVRKAFEEMVYVASDDAKIKAAPTLFDSKTLAERPEVAQAYAKVSLKHPAGPEILTKQWSAVIVHDTHQRLSQIKAATLVITGDGDLLIPPGNSKILVQGIPDAQLVVVPGGGHQILVEQPTACNKAILEFLASPGGDHANEFECCSDGD